LFATINNKTLSLKARRPRLVMAVNSPIALAYLQGQPQYFRDKGFDVVILSPLRRKDEWEVDRPQGVSFIEVPMEREIAPLRDLMSLWRLWWTVRALCPAVTNVGTPKAGLLGGFAAWLNRVPCRFYTLHGLRYETTKGLLRKLLILAECLACRFAHRVVCVSNSVRQKAISAGLATPEQTVVLGSGGCNGVDTSRFAITPQIMRRASQVRRQLGIPLGAPVLLFVGRLTRDKGIPELMQAFSQLVARFPELRLLLVGCIEDGDPLPVETRRYLETNPRVIFVGAVQDVVPYYATADVLVLPSHREGLPTVVLEAQAVGVPVVGASATGIVDVIADGETGLLFPVGDVQALADAVARLITDHRLANKLRLAGQAQVQTKFQQERILEALHREYLQFLRPRESVDLQHLSIPYDGRSSRLAAR
jgi:glycosyltransferase involved in cell wall biosynthesis